MTLQVEPDFGSGYINTLVHSLEGNEAYLAISGAFAPVWAAHCIVSYLSSRSCEVGPEGGG